MDQVQACQGLQFRLGVTQGAFPGRIHLNQPPFEIGNAQHVHRECEEAIPFGLGFQAVKRLGQAAPMFGFLHQPQPIALLADLFGLPPQVHENPDLGLQDLGHNGR